MRSLHVRHLLMCFLIIVVTIGTLTIVMGQIIHGIFQYFEDQQGANQQFLVHIQETYHQPQDIPQLQVLVEHYAAQTQIRIVVIDPEQHILADSRHILTGQILTLPLFLTLAPPPNNALAEKQTPAEATSIFSTGGHILANGLRPPLAASVFDTANQALLIAVLIVGGVAFVLAFTLSRTILKPIRALTQAARRLEQGDLSQRVSVKTPDEIGTLAHAFDTMAESLERGEQQRRQLLNDVAHELRTPLTNIRGYLEALRDQMIDPEPAIIASLYEEAMLLNSLITDLQDMSLAEAGQLHLHLVPLALEDVIAQAVKALHLQVEEKHLVLSTNLPATLPLVEADAQRVKQILHNLLQNAIKYTPQQGTVTISAQTFPHEVHVTISDTGVGIAPEQLPLIFQQFYRVDTSRTRESGGSGLGLAIVKQFVLAHGGQVSVQSHVGVGSCFTFTLPISLDLPL